MKEFVSFDKDKLGLSILNFCEFFSRNLRTKFTKYSNEKRLANINAINLQQEAFLKQKFGFEGKMPKDKRTLVLYFRRHYDHNAPFVDYMEFTIMYYILNWYVENGYSKIFTDIKVTSRINNKYPKFLHLLFPNFKYFFSKNSKGVDESIYRLKGNNFSFLCGFMSNTVYFTHGKCFDCELGSIPILAIGARTDKGRKKNIDDYVKLDFYYDEENYCHNFKSNSRFLPNRFFPRLRTSLRKKYYLRKDKKGDFTKIMTEMLRAVVELEDKMIQKLGNVG